MNPRECNEIKFKDLKSYSSDIEIDKITAMVESTIRLKHIKKMISTNTIEALNN